MSMYFTFSLLINLKFFLWKISRYAAITPQFPQLALKGLRSIRDLRKCIVVDILKI